MREVTIETSLHRQLKELYADSTEAVEVRVGRFRVDAVRQGRLVEVQHASLSSIRSKINALLKRNSVTVVKPLIRRKRLIKLNESGKHVLEQRWSPKQGGWLDIFDELIYFTRVFPHRRLRLEIPLLDIEEWRIPVERRWWRQSPFRIHDQRLLEVIETRTLSSRDNLLEILGGLPPVPFDTGSLARFLDIERWRARKIAYCLRECGCLSVEGKKGNAWLYVRAA